MYSEFFGLNRRPFSAVPSADDFVASPPIQDALDAVIHCVSQARGIAIITSQPGMGKTMLCKRMASLLKPDFRSVYLNGAGIETRRALLQAILFELGTDYVGLSEQEARLQLFLSVRELEANHRGLLLLVDEAHLLRPRMFEELRTLADYAPDGQPLIRVALCGPFELEEKLTDPALSAFNQRIGVQVSLAPLTLEESAQLLSERFRVCGNNDLASIMTSDAVELICRASDGNLRCLTQLTDHSLLLAFAAERRPIDEETVRTALDDLKELPLRWSEIPPPRSTMPEIEHQVETAEESGDEAIPPRRIYTSAELETDEFPIPEFLRAASTLETAEAKLPVEAEIHSDDRHSGGRQVTTSINSDALVSPAIEPPYAVYEVGSEMTESELSSGASPWAQDFPFEFTPGCVPLESKFYSPLMATPTKPETEMEEIPVVDRYTLLDRYLELPQARRNEFDLSQLAEISREEIQREEVAAPEYESAYDIEPELSPAPEPSSEAQILDAIHQIRRDVLGHFDKTSPIQTIPQPRRFDVVQPESTDTVSIPFAGGEWESHITPAAQRQPAAPAAPVEQVAPQEGRFSQLFTRLRLRRQRIETEQSGR